MKVALLHDYLNQLGGGERVLETLIEIFPEAPIYTLLHDPEKTLNRFHDLVQKTSFLDIPFIRKYHRWFIPLMPLAVSSLKLNADYDLIISDTAGYAKGIRVARNPSHPTSHTKHISYIHTPLRYAWEPEYINSKFKIQNSKLRNLILKPLLSALRKWDYKTAQKPDVLIANSQFIADKIKKYYNRKATVIYPPVNTDNFFFEPRTSNLEPRTPYYLAVGRLMHYKRFDLIIEAFANLGLPLKIVGSGPEEKKIKNQSASRRTKIKNIEFLGNVSDDKLRGLYNEAQALIFPQVEDFGLVAAEAQACGLPVIAYAAGGALEIIENKKTGIFFQEQTSDAIVTAIKEFENKKFNPSINSGLNSRAEIAEKAKRFSKERFKKEFLDLI